MRIISCVTFRQKRISYKICVEFKTKSFRHYIIVFFSNFRKSLISDQAKKLGLDSSQNWRNSWMVERELSEFCSLLVP